MIVQTAQQTYVDKWDAIDPNRLFRLPGRRKTADHFGYLLRHYWIPDEQLTYKRTIQQRRHSQDMPRGFSETIIQTMMRCDADRCCWREKSERSGGMRSGFVGFYPAPALEHVLTYNRSEQALRQQSVDTLGSWPVDRESAQVQAFLRQPILTPLLPIPLGFQWHVHCEAGYVDLMLTSKIPIEDMLVLIVRRRGKFRLDRFYHDDEEISRPIIVHREGITAYSLDRSLVLYDKAKDTLESDIPDFHGYEIETMLNLTNAELLPPL